LLGPMKNKNGEIATQVATPGRGGFPVIFLSAKIKDPEAALRYLDYVNSEEGRLLAYWGVEGQTYMLDNGQPRWLPEVKQKYDNNPDEKRDEGLNFLPGRFIGAFSSDVTWPQPEDQKTEWRKLEESFWKKMPIKVIDKISANYVAREWPQYDKYRDATNSLNFDTEFRKAIFAKSDEEALKMLRDIQDKYRAAGAQEMADFVAEKAAARDDIGF
jgi:putative aldouronate transport system substrate-binding protein